MLIGLGLGYSYSEGVNEGNSPQKTETLSLTHNKLVTLFITADDRIKLSEIKS